MFRDSPLESVQVVGRRKYRRRESVPEFTSEGNEGMKILVCVRGLDSIRVKESRQSCAACPHEGWRHAVRKFRRAVSVKIAVEHGQRSNIAAEWQSLKSQSEEESR